MRQLGVANAVSILTVSSFFVFPAAAMVHDSEIFVKYSSFDLFLLPKLRGFSSDEIITVELANKKLWGVCLLPFMLLFSWVLIYFLINLKKLKFISFPRTTKNILIFSLFFACVSMIGVHFIFDDVKINPLSGIDTDYSKTMSLSEYVEWQSTVYLAVMGGAMAVLFTLFTSVVVYKK